MPEAIWFLVWVVPAFYLATFTHELGHYAAARLVGIPIEAFGVGFRPATRVRRGGENPIAGTRRLREPVLALVRVCRGRARSRA